MAVPLASKHSDLCLRVGLVRDRTNCSSLESAVETAVGPVGKLVLSSRIADREGNCGEDPRAAFTYMEKDYKHRLQFLGPMVGTKGHRCQLDAQLCSQGSPVMKWTLSGGDELPAIGDMQVETKWPFG